MLYIHKDLEAKARDSDPLALGSQKQSERQRK